MHVHTHYHQPLPTSNALRLGLTLRAGRQNEMRMPLKSIKANIFFSLPFQHFPLRPGQERRPVSDVDVSRVGAALQEAISCTFDELEHAIQMDRSARYLVHTHSWTRLRMGFAKFRTCCWISNCWKLVISSRFQIAFNENRKALGSWTVSNSELNARSNECKTHCSTQEGVLRWVPVCEIS